MNMIEDRQTTRRFYDDRFSAAFPDINEHPEFTDKQDIRTRLGFFFEKPMTTADTYWFRDGGCFDVSSFSVASETPYEFLGEGGNAFLALDISRIVPLCDSELDYTACVYIESRACVETGDSGYDGTVMHTMHTSGRKLSGTERNSGRFFDGRIRHEFTSDETVELTVPTKKVNLLLVPQFGSVLKAHRDQEIEEALVGILDGDKGIPDLKSLLFSFPKPVFTYAHAYQRPLDAMKPNPELLTGLLRIIQENR